MKEGIEKLTNQELLAIYRLLLEHQEYLKTEREKIEDDSNDK